MHRLGTQSVTQCNYELLSKKRRYNRAVFGGNLDGGSFMRYK